MKKTEMITNDKIMTLVIKRPFIVNKRSPAKQLNQFILYFFSSYFFSHHGKSEEQKESIYNQCVIHITF